LHHLLAQSAVFLNLALNTFAIGPQLFPQPTKVTNEIINLARRSCIVLRTTRDKYCSPWKLKAQSERPTATS
jgi:hypothetical protein